LHQLTLSFRDRKLKVFQLKGEHITAGRDSACEIVIDSLAIEPVHARFVMQNEQVKVSPATPEARILLQGEAVQERLLQHGDKLVLGKHMLTYQQHSLANNLPDLDSDTDTGTTRTSALHPGWLQFTNGAKMGRSIPIRKGLMRIGQRDNCIALISTRDNGFYISHLEGPLQTRVDDIDLVDQTHKLESGDSIQIGKTRMLFFTDNPERG